MKKQKDLSRTSEELRIIALQLAAKDSDVEGVDPDEVIRIADKYYNYLQFRIIPLPQGHSNLSSDSTVIIPLNTVVWS